MTDPQHIWTAAGAGLDALGREECMERMGGETDVAYRLRILEVKRLQPTAAPPSFDSLAGFAGDDTIDKLRKRFATYEATQGPQPGSPAHLLMICGDCGDVHAKLIELTGSATVLVLVNLDAVGLASLKAELEQHRPAGVRVIATTNAAEVIEDMLGEARAEGARQDRSLNWRRRFWRWWRGE